jgi:predicted dehydrogenase
MQRTIPALKSASAWCEPVAIASRELATAEAAARAAGLPRAYGGYGALLAAPDIEAVYIPLPNQLHFEWCVRALEAGKHVLCEKPLTLSAAEVERLIAVRDATGGHIEEAFGYRNHPQWDEIARLIDAGEIGAPRAAHAVLAKQFLDPDDIRNNAALGGGALYDLGSYAVSAMTEIFRRPPERVSAAIDLDPLYGVDRLTTATLDYGEAQATFTVGIRAGSNAWGTHQSFSMLGSNGWLALDFPFAHARPTACRLTLGDVDSMGSIPSRTMTFEPTDQYARQVERFSRAVRGEAVRTWPIEDALLTLRIIEALFAAARDGGWRRPG